MHRPPERAISCWATMVKAGRVMEPPASYVVSTGGVKSTGSKRNPVVVKFHLFRRSQSECRCLRPISGMKRTRQRTLQDRAYKPANRISGMISTHAASSMIWRILTGGIVTFRPIWPTLKNRNLTTTRNLNAGPFRPEAVGGPRCRAPAPRYWSRRSVR